MCVSVSTCGLIKFDRSMGSAGDSSQKRHPFNAGWRKQKQAGRIVVRIFTQNCSEFACRWRPPSCYIFYELPVPFQRASRLTILEMLVLVFQVLSRRVFPLQTSSLAGTNHRRPNYHRCPSSERWPRRLAFKCVFQIQSAH